ncbi:MAG: nuclear transport factor 2 family protein, partial [Deltaproteobacteria bacterium]|nr:nuclear transport factor 2 family protein [Deltaproteobacteria bacterium]
MNESAGIKAEVWNTLVSLNRAWTVGKAEDLKNYFHKDMVAITATDRKRLEGREACVSAWAAFSSSVKIKSWKESDPKIDVYGDTAVVTYYFDISFETGGQCVNMGGR